MKENVKQNTVPVVYLVLGVIRAALKAVESQWQTILHETNFGFFFNHLSDSARINPRVWNHSANAMDKMVSPKLSHSYVLEYRSSFEVTGNEGILMDMSESQSANDIQIVIVDGLIMI